MDSTSNDSTSQSERNVQTSLEITPDEAKEGVQKQITFDQPKICETCDGRGIPRGPEIEQVECPDCRGNGQVKKPKKLQMSEGSIHEPVRCSRCSGSGKVDKKCDDCSGQGKVVSEKTLQVEVPEGIDDGQTLRLRAEGVHTLDGQPLGHLLVRIDIDDSLVHETDDEETKLLLEALESIESELGRQNTKIESELREQNSELTRISRKLDELTERIDDAS